MNHFRLDGIDLGGSLARQFAGVDRRPPDGHRGLHQSVSVVKRAASGGHATRRIALALGRFAGEEGKYHYEKSEG